MLSGGSLSEPPEKPKNARRIKNLFARAPPVLEMIVRRIVFTPPGVASAVPPFDSECFSPFRFQTRVGAGPFLDDNAGPARPGLTNRKHVSDLPRRWRARWCVSWLDPRDVRRRGRRRARGSRSQFSIRQQPAQFLGHAVHEHFPLILDGRPANVRAREPDGARWPDVPAETICTAPALVMLADEHRQPRPTPGRAKIDLPSERRRRAGRRGSIRRRPACSIRRRVRLQQFIERRRPLPELRPGLNRDKVAAEATNTAPVHRYAGGGAR